MENKFFQDFSTNILTMAFYAKCLLSLPLQTLSFKPLSTVVSEGCLLKAFSAVVSAGCLCRLFLWLALCFDLLNLCPELEM